MLPNVVARPWPHRAPPDLGKVSHPRWLEWVAHNQTRVLCIYKTYTRHESIACPTSYIYVTYMPDWRIICKREYQNIQVSFVLKVLLFGIWCNIRPNDIIMRSKCSKLSRWAHNRKEEKKSALRLMRDWQLSSYTGNAHVQNHKYWETILLH